MGTSHRAGPTKVHVAIDRHLWHPWGSDEGNSPNLGTCGTSTRNVQRTSERLPRQRPCSANCRMTDESNLLADLPVEHAAMMTGQERALLPRRYNKVMNAYRPRSEPVQAIVELGSIGILAEIVDFETHRRGVGLAPSLAGRGYDQGTGLCVARWIGSLVSCMFYSSSTRIRRSPP